MSRDESSRRSKRCRADRDFGLGPAADIMTYDDERTLDEEEALEASEDTHNELSHLQKEGDMPLKDLLVMYGYGDMSQDPNKAEDEEDDEEDEEEEEDEDDEDDDDPVSYEPDLKQFYTEMVKAEENGSNAKRASPVKNTDEVEAPALAPSINSIPDTLAATIEPKLEDVASTVGISSVDGLNPVSNNTDISSTGENINSSATVNVGGNVGGGGGSSRLLRSVSRPQSEEEEDDCDYSPDEEEWKKTIMVGSDYQAAIPEGLCKYDDALPYENEDKMLWDPSHIKEEEVEEFLLRAQLPAVKGSSLPSGRHVRDDEQALYLLLQCGYNSEEALRRRRMNALPSTESVSLWSEEECHNFETGLRNYGKDFYLIQKNKVRTRSVGELVQFYYLWKKTERHDLFTYKARLEKKKYALHPGVTDYMDRFLEEQEGVRDRSSSPNVHCLLYGDAKRQRTNANMVSNEDSKPNLDNWDGSSGGATVTTTSTNSTADGLVNSGPVDPLAIEHHQHNSPPETQHTTNSTTSSSSLPLAISNTTTTIGTAAAAAATAAAAAAAAAAVTSASLSSPSVTASPQQRNHFHSHLQQQTPNTISSQHASNNNNNNEDAEVAAVTSRSSENILPHLPP